MLTVFSLFSSDGVHEQPVVTTESLLFEFGTLRTATGNFSDANKLGEGGFGPVYKVILLCCSVQLSQYLNLIF